MSRTPTSVYLPKELRAKLQRAADAQARSASSLIAEAVRAKFARSEEGADPITLRHIGRLETRVDKCVRDTILIKETLLLFVRVWLEHNPPLEEHLADSAAASASARFERFLDIIAAGIDSGRSLAYFEPAHIDGAPGAADVDAVLHAPGAGS